MTKEVTAGAAAEPGLCIISATYPPVVCGVADYSARMVEVVGTRYDVTVFTTRNEMPAEARGPGRVLAPLNRQRFCPADS